MKDAKKIGFLIDPIQSFKTAKDTSFALMLAAQDSGHEVWIFEDKNLSYEKELLILASKVSLIDQKKNFYSIEKTEMMPALNLDSIFIRTDPPFDDEYLTSTWLLDHHPQVYNSPHGIRSVNEKIWALQFTDLIPETLVTRDINQFFQFRKKYQNVVIKPINGFGGSGIFLIHSKDSNARVAFETVSKNGKEMTIVQRALPEAQKGDKRILLLNSEPIGALLRVHSKDDHRNNFAVGGHGEPAEITNRDREIIARLKDPLQKLGLFFVGIDIIGDYLIEVNVTSPTLLREMSDFLDSNLAKRVITSLKNN